MKSVGFVGFGEAAQCFAEALAGKVPDGVVVYCNGSRHFPPYDEEFLNGLATIGASPRNNLASLVSDCDVIFSAVTVGQAEAVGQEILELCGKDQLVIDVNASTPSVKRRLSRIASERGVGYVDASVMGAVSIYGHGVQLYCSGNRVEEFSAAMTPYGFSVQVLAGDAGTASGVKMLRSVVTKGMEGLLVEALSAAASMGIVEEAFDGICSPMDATTFSKFAVMCIETDVLHSERRADEMKCIEDELEATGIEPIMTAATTRRLMKSAAFGLRDSFARRESYTYQDVLDEYQQFATKQGEKND